MSLFAAGGSFSSRHPILSEASAESCSFLHTGVMSYICGTSYRCAEPSSGLAASSGDTQNRPYVDT